MASELERLARRILRPDRPRLADARAAVAGISDPREAWEVLATRGLVRDDARPAPHRDFAPQPSDVLVLTPTGVASWRPQPTPTTVRAAVAIASDPAGIATAEALVCEVRQRLEPWGVPRPRGIRWRIEERPWGGMAADRPWMPSWPAVHRFGDPDAVGQQLPGEFWRRWPLNTRSLGRRFAQDLAAHAEWRRLVARGARVTPTCAAVPVTPGASVVGMAFAALPDPFEPLLAVWGLGYAVDAIAEEVVVLVAPGLGESD